MQDSARRVLDSSRLALDVAVAPWPRALPLIGAARSLGRPESEAALVYDFGGSTVKRALARNQSGALSSLELLAPVPVAGVADARAHEPEAVTALRLGGFMRDLIASDRREQRRAGMAVSPRVVVALACYVRDDQPLGDARGGYGALRRLPQNAGAWLSREVSRETGEDAGVTLVHDGTAAGRALAGRRRAAVIMLGTWLGVGFVPPGTSVLPLAPGFTVWSS
jgi:hypothetical protein